MYHLNPGFTHMILLITSIVQAPMPFVLMFIEF